MKLYTKAKIVAVEKNSFPDKENPGRTIEFYTNSLRNSDGEVLAVNSRDSYLEHEGVFGVAAIEITPRSQGGGYKLSLREFTPATEQPEETIS